MRQFRLQVPTYNGNRFPEQVASGRLAEFGPPETPVAIQEAAGLRIVLGTQDEEHPTAPDIQIERRPMGWAIFLHPVGGGDASGYVFFHDDGRSFVVPESGLSPTPAIKALDHDEPVPDMQPTRTK